MESRVNEVAINERALKEEAIKVILDFDASSELVCLEQSAVGFPQGELRLELCGQSRHCGGG